MKKLISLTLLLFLGFFVKGQSADETLEWLRAKQPEIRTLGSNSFKYSSISDVKLVIDESSITASNDNSTTKIPWNSVKDVSGNLGDVTIVGTELVDGKNTFIKLGLTYSISQKFIKALKHYVTIKGAKLVKEDMF